MPVEYRLFDNYPNPFNPSTTIKFSVKESNIVTLKIYDISGKEIASLVNTRLNAGTNQIKWDAANFSSGIYFCMIQSGSFKDVKRMTLIKQLIRNFNFAGCGVGIDSWLRNRFF